MRAVVYDAIGATPRVREVPEPVAPDGGVVVRVHATGLCRSDWHAWAGHDEIALPHVPGHELAGVVSAVGAGVRRWAVGDRVTVPFVCGCGRCEWCRGGDAQVCPDQQQPGFTHWGSFAEYVALHAADANLVTVPGTVGFAAAASLGCRFATAYRGLVGRARLAAGEWVAVPKAYIALAPGHRPTKETARSILRHAREHLAPYQRVRRIEFAELPKTISGKIRRVELRARENSAEHGTEWRDDQVPDLKGPI